MGNCVSDSDKVDLELNLTKVYMPFTKSYRKQREKNLKWLKEAPTRLI